MVEMVDSIRSDCKQSSAKFEILLSLHLKYNSPLGSHSHTACGPCGIVVQECYYSIRLLHPITWIHWVTLTFDLAFR